MTKKILRLQKEVPLYSFVLIGFIWHMITEKTPSGVLTNHNMRFKYKQKIKKWKLA